MFVKVSFLSMDQHVEGDPCKFVLACRGSSERLTLQAANIDIKQEWVQSIRELLDLQSNFLTGRSLEFYQRFDYFKFFRPRNKLLSYLEQSNKMVREATLIDVCFFMFFVALQNPQEYQKKESGSSHSLSRQASGSSRSSSSHPSTPLKPNSSSSNSSPAHKSIKQQEEVSK